MDGHVASLDAPLDIDPMLSIGESISDEQSVNPEAGLQSQEIESLVAQWLEQLNDKQRTVIERRWRQHQAGLADWSIQLWTVLMAQGWLERWKAH